MGTNEPGLIKDLIHKSFSQKKRVSELLPSILAISADLLDIYNNVNNIVECKAEVIECNYKNSCSNRKLCMHSLRQFYVYNQDNKKVFEFPKDLPDYLKIKNNEMKNEQKRKLREKVNKVSKEEPRRLAVADFEADVILKCYDIRKWSDECPCSFENYIACLPIVFIFNPDILCCAIEEELKNRKKDVHVIAAINKCMELYILTDIVAKNDLNVREQHLCYNNFHEIPEIEMILAENSLNNIGEILSRTEILTDIGSIGLQCVCENWCKKSWNQKSMKKVLRRKNYWYLKKILKTYCMR